MKNALLLILLMAAVSFGQIDRTRLFTGANQDGVHADFNVGETDLHTWAINDRARSISVPEGHWVTLCDEHLQRERGDLPCTSFPEGKWLVRALSERISYIRDEWASDPLGSFPVRIYSSYGQRGTSLALSRIGINDLIHWSVGPKAVVDGRSMPTWEKVASSIWIASGYTVQLNRRNHPGETGPQRKLFLS